MNKKIIYSIGILVILVTFVVIIYSRYMKIAEDKKLTKDPQSQEKVENIDNSKVYEVEEVAQNPEIYKGVISVMGVILKNDNKKMIISLGCEDACVMMPVKYSNDKNQLLKEETNVTAIGEIKQENGKYYFAATDIKEK